MTGALPWWFERTEKISIIDVDLKIILKSILQHWAARIVSQ